MRTAPVLGADECAAFCRDGYLVLERALSVDVVRQLLDALEREEAGTDPDAPPGWPALRFS